MTSRPHSVRRRTRRSRTRPAHIDSIWKSFVADNPSESQLIAAMVAILSGRPVAELVRGG